jgi:hypothetical protein
MIRDKFALVTSGVVSSGLFLVYLVFLSRSQALSNWGHLNSLEEIIVVTQIIRVLLVIVLAKPLRLQPIFAMILFSFEVFLIPCLALLAFWTGNPVYTSLMGSVLTSWIGASAVILTPYAIYEFMKSLTKETSLANVLGVGSLEVGTLVLLCGILSSTNTTIMGPSALGSLFIESNGARSVAKFSGLASDGFLEAGLVLFYLGMISYVGLRGNSMTLPILMSFALIPLLVGSLISVLWVVSFAPINPDVLIAFTVPTVTIIGVLWGISRGK